MLSIANPNNLSLRSKDFLIQVSCINISKVDLEHCCFLNDLSILSTGSGGMHTKVSIQVNPEVLTWARSRAGLDSVSLARKLQISQEKLEKWEAGEEFPTFKQAQKFAHRTFIPFGYLFLDAPPEESLPIADFRTLGSGYRDKMSPELADTVKIIRQRQEWYREYLIENGAGKCSFVRSVTIEEPVKETVNKIRNLLNIQASPTSGTYEDFYRTLISRIEDAGVLVIRGSFVGNNTHRKFNVEEFRGIAISDEFAPVIFINENDSLGARIFTLLHEFAHILLGESGISDIRRENHRKSEKFCNAVAAEFLCPEISFRQFWKEDESFEQNLALLAKTFRVSQWVVARRALDLGFIKDPIYIKFINDSIEQFKKQDKKEIKLPYYQTLSGRVSRKFTMAILSEALSGRMLLRDASFLIGVPPERISVLAGKVGF